MHMELEFFESDDLNLAVLESDFRIEKLKQQIEELVEPVALIRERKLLYKKAFITRSQNLLLAENEVGSLYHVQPSI